MRKTVSYINFTDVLDMLNCSADEQQHIYDSLTNVSFGDADMTLINAAHALNAIVCGCESAESLHDEATLCKKFWTIVAKDDYINLEA